MTPFGQTLVRTTTIPHHTECGPATTAHNARLRGEVVSARERRELTQDQTRGDGPCRHRGGELQDAGPVVDDQPFPDSAADQCSQLLGACRGLEHVDPLRRKISDTRHEPVAQDRGGGEDVIGEAAGVGVLFADATPGLVQQQAVENVGRLIGRIL